MWGIFKVRSPHTRIKQEGEADLCLFVVTKDRIHVLIEDGDTAFRALVNANCVDPDIADILLPSQVAAPSYFGKAELCCVEVGILGIFQPGPVAIRVVRVRQQGSEGVSRRFTIRIGATMRYRSLFMGFEDLIAIFDLEGSGIEKPHCVQACGGET